MEHHTITRALTIAARPETVYEVITDPRHMTQWWPDQADMEARPGSEGSITFGRATDPGSKVVPLTVIEADPPRRFSFRWAYPAGTAPTSANSFLVTFQLEPSDAGTRLTFTETGFTDQGMASHDVEASYADHGAAWDRFLPRLAAHAARVTS